MRLRPIIPIFALLASLAVGRARGRPLVDAMRGPVPIPDATRAAAAAQRRQRRRAAPAQLRMQPPIIPHRVDGYQIDKNFNKCLDCHARGKTAFSQAIPVSATHYIDRGGNVLDHVSTRRYFCMQCHVPQEPVQPLVGNSFRNADAAGGDAQPAPRAPPR